MVVFVEVSWFLWVCFVVFVGFSWFFLSRAGGFGFWGVSLFFVFVLWLLLGFHGFSCPKMVVLVFVGFPWFLCLFVVCVGFPWFFLSQDGGFGFCGVSLVFVFVLCVFFVGFL